MARRSLVWACALALAAGSCARQGASDDPFNVAREPDFSPSTYLAAGKLAESRGQFDDAIAYYRAAGERDPGNADATFRLASVLTARNDAAAIAEWERYIAQTGGSAEAWNNLALARESFGDAAAAETAFAEALRRDPANPAANVNYGLMLARAGRIDEAEARLRTVLPAGQVQYNIASAMESQGLRAQAAERYRRALTVQPDLNGARSRLAALGETP